jgi:hypothetical protein
VVRAAEMFDALQISLPITDRLVIEPVNHMFPISKYANCASGWLARSSGGMRLA